jgi:hypothetical protein
MKTAKDAKSAKKPDFLALLASLAVLLFSLSFQPHPAKKTSYPPPAKPSKMTPPQTLASSRN